MPPRTLPTVRTLSEAVLAVINQPEGKSATRFIAATEHGNAPNLREKVRDLIMNREAVEFRERELEDFPFLLTIEDFVSRQGRSWHFEESTIQMAQALVERYDQIVRPRLGHPRYEER